jgi:hypothetical protein
LDKGTTGEEVDLAATNFLAKGAIRKKVDLKKTAGEEEARRFLCFIRAPAIFFGGGQLFSLSISILDR